MNNQIEKIKAHFVRNKKIYITAGITMTVSVVTTYLLTRNVKVTNINNLVAPVFNNNNSSSVNFGGYAHKLVKCDQTGEIWETVKDAAAKTGVDLVRMSRHLNGHIPHIDEKTYSIIGVGTR